MFSFSLVYLLSLVFILISMAFYTLLERKVLSYIQSRTGPVVVGVDGLLQPFSDAVKLFSKSYSILGFSNRALFSLSPILSMVVVFIGWYILLCSSGDGVVNFSGLAVMSVFSFTIYSFMWGGWSCNSKYTFMGSLRLISQTVSYEISLALILFGLMVCVGGFSFEFFMGSVLIYSCPLFAVIWFVVMLAESNRSPFDLGEGESELVSGFNTEYSGPEFSMYFIAEYSSMLFISYLTGVLFIGGLCGMSLLFCLGVLFISSMFLFIRGIVPRMRYDKLMELAWFNFLVVTLLLLMVNCCVLGV